MARVRTRRAPLWSASPLRWRRAASISSPSTSFMASSAAGFPTPTPGSKPAVARSSTPFAAGQVPEPTSSRSAASRWVGASPRRSPPAAGELAGLVFLGYPLHPPGRPDRLRADHLPGVRAPMLFVQGSRDAFGTPAELQPIIAPLQPPPNCMSSKAATIRSGSQNAPASHSKAYTRQSSSGSQNGCGNGADFCASCLPAALMQRVAARSCRASGGDNHGKRSSKPGAGLFSRRVPVSFSRREPPASAPLPRRRRPAQSRI